MHIYFKGLKFIRFFAASIVVIHHIEQFKYMFGLHNSWENGTIRNLGDKGVTLFFVLSGFLITFLLLKEKDTSGTINIKFFYLRRILRIWPLYFLIVMASIFIFPNIPFFHMKGTAILENNFIPILLLSLAILPNITLFSFGAIPFSSQAWSIGVEEQFYLIWPLLIKYIRMILPALLIIIGVLFVLQNYGAIIPKVFGNGTIPSSYLSNVSTFFKIFRIDCMAIGSIGGILVFKKSRILNYLYNRVVSFFILIAAILLLINPYKIFLFDNLLQSFVYMALIITITTYGDCFYTVENKFTNLLGDISYGTYMYHPVVCFTIIKLFGNQVGNFGIYILVFACTFLVALLSYRLFEKKLINIKAKKYSIIHSN